VSRQVCLELTDLVRQVRMAWRVVELRAAALADADGDLDDDLAVSLEMALLGILRTADRLDLLDRWFSFREEAVKKFVIEWAEANNLQVEF